MRMLMISKYYPPVRTAQGLQAAKVAAALTEAGVACQVVCASDPWGTGEPAAPETRWFPAPTAISEGQGSLGDRVRSILARAHMRYAGDLSWWAVEAERQGLEALRSAEHGFIMARMMPEQSLVVGHRLARKSGVPWVATVSDPPTGWCPPPYPQFRTFQDRQRLRWMRWALARAPMVVFPSHRLAKYYERDVAVDVSRNHIVLPQIGWAASGVQAGTDERRDSLQLLHIGNFGLRRGDPAIDLLKALSRVCDSRATSTPNIQLGFVGGQSPELLQAVRDLELDRTVTFSPPIPYWDSLKRMQEADALIIIEAKMAEGVFLPSKLADYAASRKPVLMFSPERGEVADIVGGGQHPGFMGQTIEGAVRVLRRFIGGSERGHDLAEYRVPGERFTPEYFAGRFLAEARARL